METPFTHDLAITLGLDLIRPEDVVSWADSQIAAGEVPYWIIELSLTKDCSKSALLNLVPHSRPVVSDEE